MKALRGFLMVGFLVSFSALDSACVFLRGTYQDFSGASPQWSAPNVPSQGWVHMIVRFYKVCHTTAL
jgi:hypothetical protein